MFDTYKEFAQQMGAAILINLLLAPITLPCIIWYWTVLPGLLR